MSPALIDAGATPKNPLHQGFNPNKGQVFSPSPNPSLKHSGFISNDRRRSSFDMNSCGQSGFENSDGMNPNFEFSSPATSKLGSEKPFLSTFSSLSRQRMAKSRKAIGSRSMGSSEIRKNDPGHNPFHPVSSNLSGVSSSSRLDSDHDNVSVNRGENLNLKVINEIGKHGNAFTEVSGKFKVESEPGSHIPSQCASTLNEGSNATLSGIQQPSKGLENSFLSQLPDGMKKLNLRDSHAGSSEKFGLRQDNFGASSGVGGGQKVTDFFGATLPSELPHDFGRLNLKDNGDVSGHSFSFSTSNRKDFVFGASRNNSERSTPGLARTLPEKIEKLNIEDFDSSNGIQKDTNINSSNKTFNYGGRTGTGSGGVIDPKILDEMGRLNIGACSEGSSYAFASLRQEAQVKSSKGSSEEPNQTLFASSIREQCKHLSGSHVSLGQSNRGSELHPTAASSSPPFQSIGPNFQLPRDEFRRPCMDAVDKKGGFDYSCEHDGLGVPHFEFRTPDSKCSLFRGSSQEMEFSANKGSMKDTLSKERKENLKESSPVLESIGKSFAPENSSEPNPQHSDSYSPMDFSPYCETQDDAQSAIEPSLTSDNLTSSLCEANFSNNAAEEDLGTVKECVDINKGNDANRDESKAEQLDGNRENEVESNRERQSSDQTHYFSFSSSASSRASSFTFAASSSSQGQATATVRSQKKKNRMKVSSDICIPARTALSDASLSVQFSPISRILPPVVQKDSVSSASQKGGTNLKVIPPTNSTLGGSNPDDTNREDTSSRTAFRMAQEACEKWRLRGNQAYSSGDLEKAEDYYTQGLACIPQNETSTDCLRALVLCYSNRAATRMALGRMREALKDCLLAAELDPKFFRVHLRAANCYLALGEAADASKYFQKLLLSTDVSVEQKLIQEASDGVQKAQKVSNCMGHSAELLQGTSSDVEAALGVIADALVISPYSEHLLERKAETLFMLRRYEEVIKLCMQTLESAEKNSPLLDDDGQSSNLEASELLKNYHFRIWRYRLIIKSNFHLGKLEEALDFLEKQKQRSSMVKKYGNETLESLIPQLCTARELIRHKSAGNEAFQAGRHREAVEHYTAALSINIESRPFAAVCFGNRAAAYQALGKITDAIADCSLAIALDENYLKAISRRATLFEMIRDYKQAAKDLERLVSLLNKQADGKANQWGTSSTTNSLVDLRQARQRLYQMEEQDKKGIPLNFYLILGVEPSVTAADLKKAYRKAALKHHPDKAGQSLTRSESGDDGLLKEIAEEVYKDADRLFKMIGEAYAVLSDPAKRSRYDSEEEARNGQRKSNSSTLRMYTDSTSNTTDRTGFSSWRQWREAWRAPADPYYRGFDPTRWGGH